MGRLFLVEFGGPAGEVHFYSCRSCDTQIALWQDCLAKFDGMRRGIFRNLVNIVEDEEERMHDLDRVKDVYCVRCNRPLGWIYVHLATDNGFIEGSAQLLLNNLLFWDGTFYWNADEPVPPFIDGEEEDEDEDEDQDQSSDDSIDIMN